jgi:hypothetical protein
MKKKLTELLIKRLKEWGFTSHRRECHQSSHYGTVEGGMFIPDDEIVLEEWNNEDLINCILDPDNSEISESTEELNKLLRI